MSYEYQDLNPVQKMVVEDLRSVGARMVERKDDYFYDFAMQMGSNVLTFHVSEDPGISDSLCVEYECQGEPSGINKTESIIIAFVLPSTNEIWYVKTEQLLDIVDWGNLKEAVDNENGRRAWLVPKSKVKKEALIRSITPKKTESLNKE